MCVASICSINLYAVTIDEALDASNKKDYAKSFTMAKQLCEEGVARGCNMLGTAYGYAQGTTKNLAKAAELYSKACDMGEGRGCRNLADMYAKGEHFPKDANKADTLYQKALPLYASQCDSGKDAVACRILGDIYNDGVEGISKHPANAAKYYTKACDGGDMEGCGRLGTKYIKEEGVVKNETKAAELFTKACYGGETFYCGNLANMYKEGNGVLQNPQKAFELNLKACEAGRGFSCNELGLAYAQGKGVAKNSKKAIEYITKACDRNNDWGCANLAIFYKNGDSEVGITKDLSKASALYKKACDLGLKEACEELKKLPASKEASSQKETPTKSTKSAPSTAPFVGMDDLEAFVSDYLGKYSMLICKDAQIKEIKKAYSLSEMSDESLVEKQANAQIKMLESIGQGKSNPSATNDAMGKTVYDIMAQCQVSNGKFTVLNPFRTQIYTPNKEVAKFIAKSGGSKIALIGKAKKGETQMTKNMIEFVVESATEPQ